MNRVSKQTTAPVNAVEQKHPNSGDAHAIDRRRRSEGSEPWSYCAMGPGWTLKFFICHPAEMASVAQAPATAGEEFQVGHVRQQFRKAAAEYAIAAQNQHFHRTAPLSASFASRRSEGATSAFGRWGSNIVTF